MATSDLKCVLQAKILDFINFNAISWILVNRRKVSRYFPYISQATGLFLNDFSKLLSKVVS